MDTHNDRDESDKEFVKAAAKSLQIIECFGDGRARLSLTDVSKLTSMTRAGARRYLLTLTQLGYMEFDGKFFSLTPRILRLGYSYLSASPLPARLQPILERISNRTEESSSAAVLDDKEVVYVARSAKKRIMSIGLSVGSRLPAFCTSLGRVILANKPADWLDHYFETVPRPALTEHTKTDEAVLRAELESVRERGFAIVDEELELGLRSLAAPVFNMAGEVVCGVNISVQSHRVSVAEMEDCLLPILRECLYEVERILP
ncbi:MAG: helix-turn-helix domain-containing protein [Rhodospirillum sp.]|nr:helix-turn-helix domain-containing protein [Rhodospirillum sp.]MCF8488404.1 helix-turn-helix domain-containing protein [Rhodospirillum sp.]MCF8502973.1 helix-turn-helix domain-containing protein [Rhodospirillum sp.]